MANKSNIQGKNGDVVAMQSFAVTQHSGPLPSPESMRGYESVLKGSADRIITMAEREQSARLERAKKEQDFIECSLKNDMHELEQEDQIIKINARNSLLGLCFGFVFAIFLTIMTVYLIVKGHSTAGGIFGGTSFVTIISALIYGSRVKQREIISRKDSKAASRQE